MRIFRREQNTPTPPSPPEGTISGGLPVLVARMGATIEAAALNGMTYTLHDWHRQEIGNGRVENGVFKLSADQPVFVVEFQRP